MKNLSIFALCLSLVSGCTTIGLRDVEIAKERDFGAQQSLCICMYKDDTVSEGRVLEIISALKEEFTPFGINIEVPWVKPWKRPAFSGNEILNDIFSRALEAPCDRLFVLVGRDFRDFFWGIFMPEMHGAVDGATMTKGFAVAELGSLNQLLTLKSPSDVAAHEVYHFLGCAHGIFTDACYDQITLIKIAAHSNRELGRAFFPAMTLDGRIFWTRNEVNNVSGHKPSGQEHLAKTSKNR